MIRIVDKMEQMEMKSKLILQIHDQLVIEAKDEEKALVKKLLKEEMERPVSIRGVDRVFKVDIEEGPSLGQLEEIN